MWFRQKQKLICCLIRVNINSHDSDTEVIHCPFFVELPSAQLRPAGSVNIKVQSMILLATLPLPSLLTNPDYKYKVTIVIYYHYFFGWDGGKKVFHQWYRSRCCLFTPVQQQLYAGIKLRLNKLLFFTIQHRNKSLFRLWFQATKSPSSPLSGVFACWVSPHHSV